MLSEGVRSGKVFGCTCFACGAVDQVRQPRSLNLACSEVRHVAVRKHLRSWSAVCQYFCGHFSLWELDGAQVAKLQGLALQMERSSKRSVRCWIKLAPLKVDPGSCQHVLVPLKCRRSS